MIPWVNLLMHLLWCVSFYNGVCWSSCFRRGFISFLLIQVEWVVYITNTELDWWVIGWEVDVRCWKDNWLKNY